MATNNPMGSMDSMDMMNNCSHCPTGDPGIDQTMQKVHDMMMGGAGTVPGDNTRKMPPHGGRTANRMP